MIGRGGRNVQDVRRKFAQIFAHPLGAEMTHRRRLELLRDIQRGNQALKEVDQAAKERKFAEWQQLEAIRDITVKAKYETMTHGSRLYGATAFLTEAGLEYLEDHADEFGGTGAPGQPG